MITLTITSLIFHSSTLFDSSRQTFFPAGKELDITLTGTTVAYHEITATTAAALKDMPSMVTFYKHGKIVDTYILPTIV